MTPVAWTLISRLAPVLAPALVLAALGCREDSTSPRSRSPSQRWTTTQRPRWRSAK
jgi:hypothetical protein